MDNATNNHNETSQAISHFMKFNNLVDVKIVNGKVLVNADNLTNLLDSQMQFVRYVLDKYRIDIKKENLASFDTRLNESEETINNLFKDSDDSVTGLGKWSLSYAEKTLRKTLADNIFASIVFRTNGSANNKYNSFITTTHQWNVDGKLAQAPAPNGQPGVAPQNPITWQHTNTNDGLISRFNNELLNLLDKFFDKSTNRIYVGLVEPLTQGTLGDSISSANYDAADDNTINNQNGANYANKEKNILFRSLGLSIQRILNLRDRTDVNRIRVNSTLAEVSASIKDRMKAYLPTFVKEFDTIKSDAEFIIKFIDEDLIDNGMSLKAQLNKLVQACKSVKSTISGVHRELDDQPQYLEFYKNSLEEYKSTYGKNPLTLLSALSRSLGVNVSTPYSSSENYKLDFGFRGILYNNMNTSYVNDILVEYNNISDVVSKIEAEKFNEFVKNQINLIRLLHECKNYKLNYAITIKDNGVDYINITESNDQDRSLDIIVNLLGVAPGVQNKDNSRTNAQIMNILDLNIMPINVNALMRDVPLTNIYNYSYTFDKVLSSCYGYKNIPRIWNHINNTQDSFVQLLINPYYVISGTDNFYKHIGRIMIGVSDMNLGRPRFLSDQLWNKVLVQSVYNTSVPYNAEVSGIYGGYIPTNQRDAMGAKQHTEQTRKFMSKSKTYGNINHAIDAVKSTDIEEEYVIMMQDLINFYNNNYELNLSVSDKQKLKDYKDNLYTNFNLIYDFIQKKDIDLDTLKEIINDLYKDAIQQYGTAMKNPKYQATQSATPQAATASTQTTKTNTLLNNVLSGITSIFTGTRRFINPSQKLTKYDIGDSKLIVARSRFDSVFVRNLYFITNVQRMLMKLMRDEFILINDPVAAGNTLLDRRMTEYDPTNQYTPDAPYQG
jgi:hypothetical protein